MKDSFGVGPRMLVVVKFKYVLIYHSIELLNNKNGKGPDKVCECNPFGHQTKCVIRNTKRPSWIWLHSHRTD